MAERTIVEFEKPYRLDQETRDLLDFKLKHDIPLTTGETSALIGEDPATTSRKRVAGGDQPPFVRFGRKIRYVPSKVLAWMHNRPSYSSTSEAA